MDKFNRLRKENPLFVYKGCHIAENNDNIDIIYDFEIEGLAEFHPGWSFPKSADIPVGNNLTLERLAFSLGMAEALSYWKAACSPVMRIECGELDEQQVKWWKKLYFMGLGEFFYINGIEADSEDFIKIESVGQFESHDEYRIPLSGCLVPIGGGKDSALTLETLISAGQKCQCYAINNRNSIVKTVETAGLQKNDLLVAKRKFDRSLIKLNDAGYLNGHTPFSAVVAFSAATAAYLNGLQYIVLSNEASANESTVAGKNVNHQYSKSFTFESDFHFYEEKYLRTGTYYFSFLRPLLEFQIAELFSPHRKYLPVFRSCNLGSKVSPDIWCGKCPKCLFIAIILSPFVEHDELCAIFGKDMLNDENMLQYFIELIGRSEHKPFECVGSISEVNLAVSMTIRSYMNRGEELPFLLQKYIDAGLYEADKIDVQLAELHRYYNENNLLPDAFTEILKKEMERLA
ncbi:MAG: hypothetical protein ACI4JE_09190 [Ruminococcus sp.]